MIFDRLRHQILLIVGHYGSGKTNVAVNLAFALKQGGANVTLIDLDIVNPFFRAADAAAKLRAAGIGAMIPEFANTNVDLPSLPPSIYGVFDTLQDAPETADYFIFDVGGSDGAVALGMYRNRIEACGYDMLGVVNRFRPLTASPEDAAADLREIEGYSRLSVSGIINNSNIGDETAREDFLAGMDFGREVSRLTGLPLLFTSYVRSEELSFPDSPELFPMENATKKLF